MPAFDEKGRGNSVKGQLVKKDQGKITCPGLHSEWELLGL